MDIVALSKFNVKNLDFLKIENDGLIEVDWGEDVAEVIEALRQEKLNKIKEEEFLKKQLKLRI